MPDGGTAVAVVTTGGSDGACAAAALLLRHPQASIWVTSKHHCPHTLATLAQLDPLPARVLICGVGLAEPADEVFVGLDALAERGAAVTWLCGRGYLDRWAERLAAHCRPALADRGSNAAAAIAVAKLGRHDRAGLLAELGRQYALGERGGEEHAFWHDLLQSASDRYFQFGDLRPFMQALRKLAGLAPVTTADREEVGWWREVGEQPVTLGTSPPMRRLREQVGRVAPLDEPVLILGPSGAGKELVARALHSGSTRRGGPFLPINCAVLGSNEQLAADRLFGHVAGAYTGARRAARGAFETAAGGTLFLDEVAELPVPVQTQLLRVLEERTITPLGSQDARDVDVRLLAATNRDLGAEIAQGRFRLDLYHRLGVLCLDVPPLSERLGDLRALAGPVLQELKARGHPYKLTNKDLEAARSYSWPGNVRQYVNLIRRAALLQMKLDEVIEAERQRHRSARQTQPSLSTAERQALELFLPTTPEQVKPEADIRRAYLRHVLQVCENNITRAARALGISVNTLRKWVG